MTEDDYRPIVNFMLEYGGSLPVTCNLVTRTREDGCANRTSEIYAEKGQVFAKPWSIAIPELVLRKGRRPSGLVPEGRPRCAEAVVSRPYLCSVASKRLAKPRFHHGSSQPDMPEMRHADWVSHDLPFREPTGDQIERRNVLKGAQ